MRAGMEGLLGLLRGEANLRDLGAADWMAVLDLAAEENVLPWTAACLGPLVSASMPEVQKRLQEIDRNARISAFLWTSTLKSTLAEFDGPKIPVISLKGPWLAQRLYGDTSLRSCVDLDLLVRRDDVAGAEEVLSKIGFVAAGWRDDYQRPWRREGLTVELHHDVENPLAFDFDVEAAWDRAQRAQFEGVPAWLLAPTDELLFLCLHGVRHRFERLSHILDLTFAFQQFPPPAGKQERRSVPGSDNILALGWMMAARLDPPVVSLNDGYDRIPNRQRLEELADHVWQERLQRPAPVLDWRAKHRFYLAVETSGGKRLLARVRHLRILLTRLIDADFAFAARFHLRRRWQVWLLRPVRILVRSAPFGKRGSRDRRPEGTA